MSVEVVTAAVLVIGDEILSGRTKDKNVGFIADYLTQVGIDLKEVRVVSDDMDAIVEAVNALRSRFTYVFTTGGIGPTHDDITADSIAAAFGVGIDHDPRAMAILEAHYDKMEGTDFNEARKRMARIPFGADLIKNKVSSAPGFRLENVHVMAGVPSVMQAMMDEIVPTLRTNSQIESVTIDSGLGEGLVAGPLSNLQTDHPQVVIGSYPYIKDNVFATNIVLRSRDKDALSAAADAVHALLTDLKGHHQGQF
ncbi:molybdenum cofactor synthesis domain-containing protein [Cohaesibacter sp. ES.047]|uniref:competence/damage-inducible protein A n=1 Tax=Cohaesibacter sp. ES.047 TaxID=1798205 RepID=UPI000BB7CF70|nr:competence/damage-inducible protein A [Cohaesibacter sp. ES.047]SNY94201.1 molybdenum cofactor synthesis domain-containing protein [Cohaesibacter sp. ES.047]